MKFMQKRRSIDRDAMGEWLVNLLIFAVVITGLILAEQLGAA